MYLVQTVCSQIFKLVCADCDGCKYYYDSFSQHSCYATDWRSHVLTYYKQALLILEIKDEPLELFVSVFENGSSYG